MTDPSIVLIGPADAGKSTVGPLVAAELGREFVDLDEIAEPYYTEAGQPLAALADRIGRDGMVVAHRWWQPARVHAARAVIEDHRGAVIAFGAGHAHYEDAPFAASIRLALQDSIVVLLLPDDDPARSVERLRTRRLSQQGDDWIRDGHDFIDEWVRSEQHAAIADVVVHAGDADPTGHARMIVDAIRRRVRT